MYIKVINGKHAYIAPESSRSFYEKQGLKIETPTTEEIRRYHPDYKPACEKESCVNHDAEMPEQNQDTPEPCQETNQETNESQIDNAECNANAENSVNVLPEVAKHVKQKKSVKTVRNTKK